jgi:MoaA/NifB/PqqE/SkfB family radical SAM enzyme
LQLHLALHAYHNGVRSEAIKELILRHYQHADEYKELASKVRLPVFSVPQAHELLPAASSGFPAIRPTPAAAELVDGAQLPIYLDLNTLNRCNVSCVMCPFAIRYDDQGIEKDEYYRLTLDEYKSVTKGLTISSAHFVGAYAEPLINKEIFALVGYAHEQGSLTAITSNGMALTPEFSERLIEVGLDMLTISLHGARSETAEAVMRRSKFERVISNIQTLQALKKRRNGTKPEIYFNYVGMRLNAEDLPDFVDLAANLEVQHVNFIHLIDGDTAVDSSQNLNLYPELLDEVVSRARARARLRGVNLYVSPAYEAIIETHRARNAGGEQESERKVANATG